MDKEREGLFNDNNLIRGAILSITVEIEHIMDYLIASHFCQSDERGIELIHFALTSDKISLENKRQVLEAIISKHHLELYQSNLKNTMRDLERRIIPKRNEFAHGLLHLDYTEDQKTTGGIGMMRYKNQEKLNWYTYEDITDLFKLMKKCVEELSILAKQIRPANL